MKSITIKKIVIIFVPLLLGLGVIYYASLPTSGIVDFDYNRDAQEVHALFNRDWYWLIAASQDEYDFDFVLRYRALHQNLASAGSLNMKVFRENNEFKGFVAYHKLTPEVCKILFLAVKSDERKKGYGKQLAEYAIHDLFEHGCKKIILITRPGNEKALRLYGKLGFKETGHDEEFFYMELNK